MEGASGQQYVVNVFGRGVAQDLLHDLPAGQVRDTYIRTERLAINQKLINGLSSVTGDVFVSEDFISSGDGMRLLALAEMNGYLYTFWAVSTGTIWIYRDDTLIGNSPDFPGVYADGHLYIDTNSASSEIAITDNTIEPVVFDMDDMYDLRATTTYNTAYDSSLYVVNQDVGLTQPRFVGLDDVGSGGGARVGSNAYSYRLVSDNGDETPWSPSTPFIPVPSMIGGFSGDAGKVWPGAKTYGADPSLEGSRYGVTIKIRANNDIGFDFLEIKRIANNAGGPVDYTASAEFIRYPERITGITTQIISFTDLYGLLWAPLDESNTIVNSIIDTARTVRFYDGRLVLGGIKYKSVSFDSSSLFTEINNALGDDMYATARKEDLGIGGYKDNYNQVYKKSYRISERYRFGILPWDLTGNALYAVPVPNFEDFQFPDRRDVFTAGHAGFSDGEIEAAAVLSYTAQFTDKVHEVYKQGTTQKDDNLATMGEKWNVLIDTDITGASPVLEVYSPITPTGRDAGYGGNGNDSRFYGVCPVRQQESTYSFFPDNFGHSILGTGLKLGGVDISEFPDHISGFSVNRTKPAGRVVTQGLATYALIEHDGTNLQKALDKVWVHLPETDVSYGDKASLYQDMKDNPGDYEMQLVSPIAFNTEMYSGFSYLSGTLLWGKEDMVSYANCYYAGGNTHPMDNDAQVGRGDGYPTFGRWRNASQQGSGITSSLTFDISSAEDVGIAGKNGRSQYLELTLGSNLYYYADNGAGGAGSTDGNEANSRNFHEPWYVVNIVKNGRTIPQNNINLYQEIGQYIKLKSLVGLGSGDADQQYELVSERRGDILNVTGSVISESLLRYIYVNDQLWLDVTNVAGGTITTFLTDLESNGYFVATTVPSDVTCYGMYDVAVDGNDTTIIFPHTLPISGDSVCPASGDTVEIRYNNNEYIDVWGGDVIIDEVPVGIIDCETPADWNATVAERDAHFRLSGAMPAYEHLFPGTAYYQPKNYDIAASNHERTYTVELQYVRQWLATFMMESTINIPFLYKDFFPHKNYVIRPMKYDEKQGTETVIEYLEDLNIQSPYNTDYPEEYLAWGRGGFYFPTGYNLDHNKGFSKQYGSEPGSGISEVLEYPKRIHWSSKQSPSRYGLGFVNTFLSTNIYDMMLKTPKEINILYDQYSSKGSNLYAITDRGVVGFITDKQLLREGTSDELGIILTDSAFVQAEIWLDPYVGSPDARWRGRAEGVIRTANNTHIPALVFIGDDDIYLLSSNSVVSLGTNFRTTLKSLIEGLEWYSTLSAAFDPGRNELWLLISDKWYIYSFSVNNWVGEVNDTYAIGLTSTKLYDSTRMTRIGVTHIGGGTHTSSIFKGDAGFDFDTGKTSQGSASNRPTIEFAVTPAGASQFEFIDMYVNSTTRPYSIIVATDADFTDPYTVLAAGIKNINNLYRVTLGSTAAGKKLIANTLYVKIAFEFNQEVNVGYVKTGYKKVLGG